MIYQPHQIAHHDENFVPALYLILQILTGFFFFFWLRWVFIAVHGLSLVVVSGGYSLLRCAGFSLQWLLLLQSMGSRVRGLQ